MNPIGRAYFFGAALAALTVVVVGAYALFGTGEAEPPERLRLGAYDGDVGALEWIAKDMGFFAEVGLDATLTGFASGNDAVAALNKGEVDVATAADLVVAKRTFDDATLRVLANVCRYWNKALIARADRGIATPADLKGKRIGVPRTSSAEHNLMVFLALHGLTAADVEIVDLKPKQIVDGMADGGIDAALVWMPHTTDIQKRLGANAVTLMDGGTEAYLLLVLREGAAPPSSALEKLLRGLILAEDWLRRNPDEAKAYLATRFALDPAYVDALWPRMQMGVDLPQEILGAMDNEARWIARDAGAQGIPNYAQTIRSQELRAVKPSAVGVFTE